MKIIFRWLAFPLILAMAIALWGENAGMASYNSVELAQLSSIPNQKADLEVAVPESATITRKEGKPSLTGHLTAFNKQNLTLSASGYSETVSLNQVKSIEFNGDVWIEGKPLPSRIRGYVKVWTGVPVTALILQNSSQSARVNLGSVLTPEDLQKLLNIKDKTHILKKVVFDSPQKMTLEAFAIPNE